MEAVAFLMCQVEYTSTEFILNNKMVVDSDGRR